ncbi:MAG: CapA family protein [FCB group bacterium]|nr:CapA family protein [FCB group bacterium]
MKKLFIALAVLTVVLTAIGISAAKERVENLHIYVQDGRVFLTWDAVEIADTPVVYVIERHIGDKTVCFLTTETSFSEPLENVKSFYTVYVKDDVPFSGGTDETIIESFESGAITLYSYPGQDQDPNSWNVSDYRAYDGDYSLRLYGNTWKIQAITPMQIAENTMWGVAAFVYRTGEIQAFGVGNGEDELFYVLRGDELADSAHWRNTFRDVGGMNEWNFFTLPVGLDWMLCYGYEPVIDRLFYVNDHDGSGQDGGIYYDFICDITEDMPLPPTLTVDFEYLGAGETPGWYVQFSAEGEDPDSDTLYYYWEFGDGSDSEEQNPLHIFPNMGYYTVNAEVYDEADLVDHKTIHLLLPAGTANELITVNFTGDVMMARRYDDPGGIIPTMGVNAIWEPSLDILGNAADLTIINLECPLTDDTSQPHPTKDYIFHGQPEYVSALTFAGIDGVTLANNHISDYMDPGLIETCFVLDTAGVKRCGAGMDDYQSNQPMVLFANGISVCVLGYCNRTGRIDNLAPFLEAGPNKAGFTWFTEYYLEESVPQAAELYDIVVAQVHCGTEYDILPDTSYGGDEMFDPEEAWHLPSLEIDSTTLNLQHLTLDLGADIVISHHPHVLQGYSVYDGKLIAHSLGNYAFDQNNFETYPSMILYAEMTREEIYNYYYRPVYIDDYIPDEARGELGKDIIDRIADYSRLQGTIVMPDYAQNIAYIALDTNEVVSYEQVRIDYAYFINDSAQSSIRMSLPKRLANDGFLSEFISVSSSSPMEVILGRDMLLVGNMEDEGATLWELDNVWVTYDNQVSYTGQRSICLKRNSYQSYMAYVVLEDRFSLDLSKDYTICGYVKTANADSARITIRYYVSRTGAFVDDEILAGPLTGTQDWTYFSYDLRPPPEGDFGNFMLVNTPPAEDDGYFWVDDLKLIMWDDEWNSIPVDVEHPNNYRFFRLMGESEADSVKVSYIEKTYIAK